MVPQAIRMAESAFRKYRTRNPFEIIEARKITLKGYDQPETLLGFYTVMNRKQFIGINNAADGIQRLTGAIHELGHSLNDYKIAASGNRFDDFRFFSMSCAPAEFNANLTGADLFIGDEYILDRICYEQYARLTEYISSRIDRFRTEGERMRFEEEQMLDFYSNCGNIPSYDQLAAELGVDGDGQIRGDFSHAVSVFDLGFIRSLQVSKAARGLGGDGGKGISLLQAHHKVHL